MSEPGEFRSSKRTWIRLENLDPGRTHWGVFCREVLGEHFGAKEMEDLIREARILPRSEVQVVRA